jgi:hypothetical protein
MSVSYRIHPSILDLETVAQGLATAFSTKFVAFPPIEVTERQGRFKRHRWVVDFISIPPSGLRPERPLMSISQNYQSWLKNEEDMMDISQ